MARPLKTGLNYFPFDVDFFDDPRVGAAIVEHGIKGQAAVVMLLCTIYRNGYYVEWTPANRVAILKQLPGITLGKMEKIVGTLAAWDFFDRTLFEQHQVLTSRDIQQHYLVAARRRKHASDEPLLYLLDDGSPTATTANMVAGNAMTTAETPEPPLASASKTTFQQTKTAEMTAETTQEEYIKINEIYQDSPSPSTPAYAREDEQLVGPSCPPSASETTPPAPSRPCSAAYRTPLSTREAVAQMKGNRAWKESVCMRHHITIGQVDDRLDEFALDCECRGKESHDGLGDVQSHFCNWLLVAQQKASHQQQSKSLTLSNHNNHATHYQQRTSADYIEEAKQWAIEQTLRTIRTPSNRGQEVQSALPF